MPKNRCAGKKPPMFKWSKERVTKEALKYSKKSDFRENSAGAYDAAIKNKWIDEVCGHMEIFKHSYSLEQITKLFSSCKNKKEAREKDYNAYVHARNNGWGEIVFFHMPKKIDKSGTNSPFYKWTDEELEKIALKYKSRVDFSEFNCKVYRAAYKRGILDKICSHMGEPVTKSWEYGDLVKEALKHITRVDFQRNGSGAYQAANKRGILDQLCQHMKRSVCVSSYEVSLFDQIKSIYPKTQKLRDMKVKIEGKSHIKGFDIDIYVPELRKGIEFDGKYWHSDAGLKRSRSHWPQEDILNYHRLKDDWFFSKDIRIFHIKEEDWIENKEKCIKRCLEFLGEKDGL
jgi:hypothetical protein